MDGYRVRVGSDVKFYAATADKPAVAYVDLVQDNWERIDDGQFVEKDPTWYKGEVRGEHAQKLAEHFQKGDPLLVIGQSKVETTVAKDGREFVNNRLYISTFGPDASKTEARIDRDAVAQIRAQREQAQQQRVAQTAGQGPSFREAEPAPAQPQAGPAPAQPAAAPAPAQPQAGYAAPQYQQQQYQQQMQQVQQRLQNIQQAAQIR